MTGCQIVDADRDDRVQDDDLTQEHDFRLGTIGAEEVPTRCNNLVVVVVRNVYPFLSSSTIDIVGMRSRPARNYSLYRTSALASIQLLFEVG